MTKKDQIIEKTLKILADAPKGMRYSELFRAVHGMLPDLSKNTLSGTLWNLDVKLPDQIYKPARGLWMDAKFREDAPATKTIPTPPAEGKVAEKDFYEPFAGWLVNDLEECTKAVAIGGKSFKDKWGTPDVIGIREPRKSDIIRFPTEIISAEIKLDSGNLITAFGQACAYRLFSHKSYIVVPAASPEDDLARLDTLARIFGIGLILFDAAKPKSPDFDIRVRATKHEPDMFYVNRSMKLVEDLLFS